MDFEISQIFCAKDPAKICNLTNMPLVHGKHPRTTWWLAIRALAWGGGGAAEFWRAGRAPGQGSGGARPCAHLGPGDGWSWGGERAGMGAQ
jgi:hypothetical protein